MVIFPEHYRDLVDNTLPGPPGDMLTFLPPFSGVLVGSIRYEVRGLPQHEGIHDSRRVGSTHHKVRRVYVFPSHDFKRGIRPDATSCRPISKCKMPTPMRDRPTKVFGNERLVR